MTMDIVSKLGFIFMFALTESSTLFISKLVCDFDALASSFHNMTMDIVSKLGFIFMFALTEYVSGISLTSSPAQIKAPGQSLLVVSL
ncbi:immunoglobulin mu heavy chain [Labeo rohita]|nr:immunoglobulin mu heavy chain [Labeo rohita]